MKRRVSVIFIVCVLAAMMIFPASAQEDVQTVPEERQLPRLVDDADLLDDFEEEELLAKLDEISERQQFDVAVVTVNTLEGKTPQAYADDFYDYNGYGMGDGNDGMLLLVSMEDRDWHITTTGFGITAITDAGIEYISERFLPDLSDGEYAAAFDTYANLCDRFVTQAKEGEPYDSGNMPEEKMSVFWVPGSLLIGFLLALIPMYMMKRQLKSVRMQPTASSYVRPGSEQITEHGDRFLYHTISRTARPKDNDSGSSVHYGSSGTRHGGGGGKF